MGGCHGTCSWMAFSRSFLAAWKMALILLWWTWPGAGAVVEVLELVEGLKGVEVEVEVEEGLLPLSL